MDYKISSESTALIAEALSKAQANIGVALKDSSNPFYKSKYADLNSIWNACQKPLTENGLAFTSSVSSEGQSHTLIATLMHSSGEWVRTFIPLILTKQDMQGLMAATTYGRRCALSALCNVSTEDDDGETNRMPEKKDQSILIDNLIFEIDGDIGNGMRDEVLKFAGVKDIKNIPIERHDALVKWLNGKIKSRKAS